MGIKGGSRGCPSEERRTLYVSGDEEGREGLNWDVSGEEGMPWDVFGK